MARVTTESCLKNQKIGNRFELVLIASFRAKCIESGSALGLIGFEEGDSILGGPANDSPLPVDYSAGEKSVVLALREIEYDMVDVDLVKAQLLHKPKLAVLHDDQINLPEESSEPTAEELVDQVSDSLEEESFYVSANFEEGEEDASEDKDLE